MPPTQDFSDSLNLLQTMLNSSPNVFLGSLQKENIIVSKVYGTDANVMKLEGCVASKPTVVISPNQDTTPSFLFFFVSLHSFDIIETKAVVVVVF